MNLSLSDEQRLIKETFSRLFEKESSLERVRAVGEKGFDAALWTALVEVGAPLARAPSPAGMNLSLLDAALIAEESGRHLASAPLVEVIVSARALAALGEVGTPWLEKIAHGDIIVPAIQPVGAGDLNTPPLPGGSCADCILVLQDHELFILSGPRPGVVPANSGHMAVAAWPLARAGSSERHLLASGTRAQTIMQSLVAEWRILSAAALAGLTQRALQLASAYAAERQQFGRPVGSFQGLAHPLADAATDVDGGLLFVWKAIWTLSTEDARAAAMPPLSWWWMTQAAAKALRRSIRALGGYGLSLEYDLQLFHRRGSAMILLGGDPQRCLEQAGEILYSDATMANPDPGDIGISFSAGDAADRYATAMREFFRMHWNEQLQGKAHHSSKSHDKEFHRQLGTAGLLFPNWPAAYGGTGISAAEEYAGGNVFEEWNYTTHVISITGLVGAVVMRFGSTQAKQEILPRIKAGEAICSLGFSEAASGSDVFAARTAARRDGGEWIINGQKMFTTAGHLADYVLLLTRTDNSGAKHQGLTLFVVPTRIEGYGFQAVQTYQDERTNITFYHDMRVPDTYRLGEVNEGARVMSSALALEHGGESYFRAHMRMLKSLLTWAQTAAPGAAAASGARPIDDCGVRWRAARIRARYEVGSCFVARGVWAADTQQFHRAWGPMSKMFISESLVDSCWEILEMGGPASLLVGDHPLGVVELDHRRGYGMTIYGGTDEIHRSLIAEQFLGLPKSRS